MGRPARTAAEVRGSSLPASAVVCVICKAEVADAELMAHVDAHERELRQRIRRRQEAGWFPWSFSSLDTYQKCPREYALGLEVRTDSGDAAMLGKVVHRAYAALAAGEAPDLGDLPMELETDLQWLLGAFEQWAPPADAEFEAEEMLEWPITTGLWAQARCLLDVRYWVDEPWVRGIDDYKSGRKVDKKGHQLQRKIYALAEHRRLQAIGEAAEQYRVRTIYLKWKKAEEDTFTATDLDKFEIALWQVVEKMALDEKYEAKPHPDRCRICDFATRCDAGAKVLSEFRFEQPITTKLIRKRGSKVESEETTNGQLAVVIPEVADSEESLRQLVKAKVQIDGMSAAIGRALNNALAKRNGQAIDVPELEGAWAAWKNVSKRVKDIDAYIQLVIEKGLTFEEAGLTVNHQRAHWLLKKDPELAAVAEEVEDRYARKEFRKYKEDEE